MSCTLRVRYTPAVSQKGLSAVFAWPCPRTGPHELRDESRAPAQPQSWSWMDLSPNSRVLIWFSKFPSRRYLHIPRQSVPCFTSPAARNSALISSLILPSCKYQLIVNNSCRELNNGWPFLCYYLFIPKQTKIRPLILLLLILKKANYFICSLKEIFVKFLLLFAVVLWTPSSLPPPQHGQEGWMSHSSSLPLLTNTVFALSTITAQLYLVTETPWHVQSLFHHPGNETFQLCACFGFFWRAALCACKETLVNKHKYKLWMASFLWSF